MKNIIKKFYYFFYKDHILNKLKINQLENKLNEVIWSQVFRDTIAASSWLKNKAFSPGRWAAGYPFLYILYRIYNDIRPKNILEMGLGESSKLLYQYINAYGGKYRIVEHNAEWVDIFVNNTFNISDNVINSPLETQNYKGFNVTCYANLIPEISKENFDLIVIDGPFGSNHFSRIEVLEIAQHDLLAEKFIILMDDFNRDGEKNTIEDLKNILIRKNIDFKEGEYIGEKSTKIICSPNYSFLTSL